MGQFINTERNNTLNSLIDGVKNRLSNPYYIYNDKSPCECTYYNQNIHQSTLDEGSKLAYAILSDDSSPIKFNKIYNFYIYGIDRIQLDFDNGEFGLENGGSIEGEAFILPNTIVPIANDFFYINYLDHHILFKVTSVTPDTIENGANFYRIEYKVDKTNITSIDSQIAEEFTMIVNNVGSQFNTIIRNNDYNLIQDLEELISRLKQYYNNLFYNNRVQTYTFIYNNYYFYDPYMIEFIIRNSLLSGEKDYVYIRHQTNIPVTFAIDYDKTFFRAIEQQEYFEEYNYNSTALLIEDITSILTSRIEDYFSINYNTNNYLLEVIHNIDQDLVNRITNNELYNETDVQQYCNIIIKYINKIELKSEDLKLLEDISYSADIKLFYHLPILIYILNNFLISLVKK